MINFSEYQKIVRLRLKGLDCLIGLTLLIMILDHYYLKSLDLVNQTTTDFVSGFIVGLLLVLAVYTIRLRNKYKNTTELEKFYIKEHDEREILIRMKSGSNVIRFLSLILLVISIPIGYINETIFFTIVAVIFFNLLISFLLKLYWSKKL